MATATAHTVTLAGALGHLVDVEVDISSGQAGITLVGRAEASLREGPERVRMAIINSGLQWPASYRTTILLSPADLQKSGTHVDLAIAVAALAADGQVPADGLLGTAFVGELTLGGGLRPATGVLPMVLAAAERGIRRVVVPEPQAEEAAMVPGMTVLGFRSLGQVAAELRGDPVPAAPPVAAASGAHLLTWRGDQRLDELDLADLAGMDDEKYSLEVAAAGGHAMMLDGPKGVGKTSLVERLPTILPDLTAEESLELTAIHSLAGTLDPALGMITRPPYSSPHHDASRASLIGGGSGSVKPGELSKTHSGVIFLDEFPLFRADVIEALRQPLESGEITVARREESVTLPARGLMVLAANPCPCGEYSDVAQHNRCKCDPVIRRSYRRKLSGPVLDRIDIFRHVRPRTDATADRLVPAEPSVAVLARVTEARERQAVRYAGCDWRLNSQVPAPRLKDEWSVSAAGQELVRNETYRGRLSARGAVRVLRLAWTVADVTSARLGRDIRPGVEEVGIALRLRTGQPLPSRAVRLLVSAPVEDAG
ncbi:MAG: YifB family Mg chelatase-like AAA ATPase [Nocardioidaceae bacterium]|nr:YifB family Mg chelatase-like AAA ATPase [Nocardioidaceae bacterium]MCL2612290.1 YifB family Mg chelatase-like AAA ATPase [Nocardioidaceae bacterium]